MTCRDEVARLRGVMMRWATVLVARGEISANEARSEILGLDSMPDPVIYKELPEEFLARLHDLEAPHRKLYRS